MFPEKMAKAKGSSWLVSVCCSLEEFVEHQDNKNTLTKTQREMSNLLLKKFFFSFKEQPVRDWNYWCKRFRRVTRQLSAPSSKERRRTLRSGIAQVFYFKLWSLFRETILQPSWKERSSERLRKILAKKQWCTAIFSFVIKFAFGSIVSELLYLICFWINKNCRVMCNKQLTS